MSRKLELCPESEEPPAAERRGRGPFPSGDHLRIPDDDVPPPPSFHPRGANLMLNEDSRGSDLWPDSERTMPSTVPPPPTGAESIMVTVQQPRPFSALARSWAKIPYEWQLVIGWMAATLVVGFVLLFVLMGMSRPMATLAP